MTNKRQLDTEDLRWVMQRAEGRRFLRRLMDKCHPYISTFNPDPCRMAYAAGEANIGLWLKSELETTDKAAYHRLMAEASQDLLTHEVTIG